MNLKSFHNPDLCLPVIRHRIGDELLYLLATFATMTLTRGWSALSGQGPERKNYVSAAYRLSKAGLIAGARRGPLPPQLTLTEAGKARLPDLCKARRPWIKKWPGRWYVLTYDVPEKERPYREALREFLKRMRMGRLHRSVWVSPHDIRPEYADLLQAASIGEYAFLLEARTVLGQPAYEIVESAWDWDSLYRAQSWYLKVYSENIARVDKLSFEQLVQLAKEEIHAYLTVMATDPFLPTDLLPTNYVGDKAHALHHQLVRAIADTL